VCCAVAFGSSRIASSTARPVPVECAGVGRPSSAVTMPAKLVLGKLPASLSVALRWLSESTFLWVAASVQKSGLLLPCLPMPEPLRYMTSGTCKIAASVPPWPPGSTCVWSAVISTTVSLSAALRIARTRPVWLAMALLYVSSLLNSGLTPNEWPCMSMSKKCARNRSYCLLLIASTAIEPRFLSLRSAVVLLSVL